MPCPFHPNSKYVPLRFRATTPYTNGLPTIVGNIYLNNNVLICEGCRKSITKEKVDEQPVI